MPTTDILRIRLRPTQESDLDFVRQLESDAANSPYVGSWSRDEHRAAIAAPDRQHWVVELQPEGRRVGYVIGFDLRAIGLGVHLKRIVVAEKSRGIGKAAVARFTEQAVTNLHPEFVWLDVLEHNERARAAYRAAGYEVRPLSEEERATWGSAVGDFGRDSLVMIYVPPRS